MSAQLSLPEGVHFIERDWLSANHVVLTGGEGPVLIDSGYLTHAATSRALIAKVLGGTQLRAIVSTHLHSDHMGCNAYLQRWHRCPIWMSTTSRGALDRWDEKELWLGYADQMAERFDADCILESGKTYRLGALDWEAHAAPGHDDVTLMFFNRQHGILITADALWEYNLGFVPPQIFQPGSLERVFKTLELIESLPVKLVIPGHGPCFSDLRAALTRARNRIAQYASDDLKLANGVVKGMFVYSMLWREQLPRAAMLDYVRQVGVHREYNAAFFKLSDEAYVEWLIADCVKHGVITDDGITVKAVRR